MPEPHITIVCINPNAYTWYLSINGITRAKSTLIDKLQTIEEDAKDFASTFGIPKENIFIQRRER